jgi:hypothetical protein
VSEKIWWEATLTFEATKDEAEVIFEALTETACGGEGEGEAHECRRDVIGSLKPSEDLDSECVQVQAKFTDKVKQMMRWPERYW